MAPPSVSNTAADKAGEIWREYLRGFTQGRRVADMTADERERTIKAYATIVDYRTMHGAPMAKVTTGIRSMVRTTRRRDDIRPGQRFKRLDRILTKLARFPRMRLSQMEDIGGCRVVLPSVDEVYAVLARIRHNWPDNARVSDYIADPKPDGYRGIHVVHKRDGRLIEVQLRTERQHEWAEAIETSSPRVSFNLKDGAGPADLREYFKRASDRLALEDAGRPPDPVAEEEFATLRERVVHYFERAP